MDDVQQDFFRIILIKLASTFGRQAILFKGKYKHNHNTKWATFSNVRIITPSFITKSICDHINVERKDLGRYFILNIEHNNMDFIIRGYPSTYQFYNNERDCIVVKIDTESCPLQPFTETEDLKRLLVNNYSFNVVSDIKSFFEKEFYEYFKKFRIYELSKKLNVRSKNIIELLRNKNITVKNHLVQLEDAQLNILLEELNIKNDSFIYDYYLNQ